MILALCDLDKAAFRKAIKAFDILYDCCNIPDDGRDYFREEVGDIIRCMQIDEYMENKHGKRELATAEKIVRYNYLMPGEEGYPHSITVEMSDGKEVTYTR